MLREYLTDLPLVAILRGLRPENAKSVGMRLVDAGFRIIEVPLNSPEPFRSIEILAREMPDTVLIGAGTVLDPDDVNGVLDVGGKLIVMPHADVAVIARAKELRHDVHARRRHADRGFRRPESWRRRDQALSRRGNSAADRQSMARGAAAGHHRPAGGWNQARQHEALSWMQAPHGFGLGSALFTPALSADDVGRNARAFADAWKSFARRVEC